MGKGLAFTHTHCQDWDQGLLSLGPITQSCLKSGKSRPEARCFKLMTASHSAEPTAVPQTPQAWMLPLEGVWVQFVVMFHCG